MEFDKKLIEDLINLQNSQKLEFTMYLDGNSYSLNGIVILKFKNPVNRLVKRGGLYFSDVYGYKIKVQTTEKSIVPMLSSKMLGPNTEFGDIILVGKAILNGVDYKISLHTNLTNSVETIAFVELNLSIIGVEFE